MTRSASSSGVGLLTTDDKAVLAVRFTDLWKNFHPERFFLLSILGDRWDIRPDDDANLLIYGPYGSKHREHRGTKLLISGEPWQFAREACDFSISWHWIDEPSHLRVPNGFWYLFEVGDEALDRRTFRAWVDRPNFCNFIYANGEPPERRAFFEILSRRRFVHSPGSVDTNTEPISGRHDIDWRGSKIAYQRQFRFSIAFENSSHEWYTTEKIVDALLGGTIPIYWGNPRVSTDVNPSTFVNAHDFGSLAELADFVVALDEDRDNAQRYFESRPIAAGAVAVLAEEIRWFFQRVVDDIGRRRLRKLFRVERNRAAWWLRRARLNRR